MLLVPVPPPGALRAEAEGVRARKGSSQAVFLLPRGLASYSKWKLPEGDFSSGVLGVESEPQSGPPPGRSRAREEKAARHSAEGPPAALARGALAGPSPSSRL